VVSLLVGLPYPFQMNFRHPRKKINFCVNSIRVAPAMAAPSRIIYTVEALLRLFAPSNPPPNWGVDRRIFRDCPIPPCLRVDHSQPKRQPQFEWMQRPQIRLGNRAGTNPRPESPQSVVTVFDPSDPGRSSVPIVEEWVPHDSSPPPQKVHLAQKPVFAAEPTPSPVPGSYRPPQQSFAPGILEPCVLPTEPGPKPSFARPRFEPERSPDAYM
jgi:hypothetical protein